MKEVLHGIFLRLVRQVKNFNLEKSRLNSIDKSSVLKTLSYVMYFFKCLAPEKNRFHLTYLLLLVLQNLSIS